MESSHHSTYSRSFSDSKLPLAELEIQTELREMERGKTMKPLEPVWEVEKSTALNKRDSRTGEELDTSSKHCTQSLERCFVRGS